MTYKICVFAVLVGQYSFATAKTLAFEDLGGC